MSPVTDEMIAPSRPLDVLRDHCTAILGERVKDARLAYNELTIEVPADRIIETLTALRDDPGCLFKVLLDVTGVDRPEREMRFTVVYHLLSMKLNQRVRVVLATDEYSPVPSVVSVFSTANWFERETWDMYGILFADHPDLRRLLTDYGFDGHPLRKDFPLTGYVEMRYDPEQQRVIYEPVKLRQDFRSFDFLSPWEGSGTLPGDEKAS
jgi:NADH-quinone oxidoreductase subunit C